ncbi:hypothetical protein H4582DRAFT_1951851 [Lactarius indigo]|nr:hypothetical protein H4582DRAFT_2031728 [Lactarius indigo]KAI9437984.1 hypothetical protein H4582DRAFT_1951851 [Lactarius indigo]
MCPMRPPESGTGYVCARRIVPLASHLQRDGPPPLPCLRLRILARAPSFTCLARSRHLSVPFLFVVIVIVVTVVLLTRHPASGFGRSGHLVVRVCIALTYTVALLTF